MSDLDTKTFDETRDDGGDAPLGEVTLQLLKDEIERIATEGHDGLWLSHLDTENVRRAFWDTQSDDGLKHAEANTNEEPAKPFEGATDSRVRLADMLVNEDVMLVVVATLRAQMRLRGVTADDTTRAANMETVLRYSIRQQAGVNYLRELIKCAQYAFADSPGVALAKLVWRTRTQLAMKTVTPADLAEIYVQQAAAGLTEATPDLQAGIQAAAAEFMAMLADPLADEGALADWLLLAFPYLRKKRARAVIKDLRETGAAQFPAPVEIYNGPELAAKRLYEDWYASGSTPTDFQRCPIWFESEWLNRTEIVERQISEGWSQEFVEKLVGKGSVLGHEGESAFPEYFREATTGDLQQRDTKTYSRMYNVLTAWFKAVNEDGVPGLYYVVMHKSVDVAAHERRLLEYPHGKWPGATLMREILGSRMMDSRGLVDLAAAPQSLMKLHVDVSGDNAQIGGVPPILTKNRRNQGVLYIAPLLEIPLKRDGDVRFMEPPRIALQSKDHIAEIRRQINEYHGRPGEGIDPQLVQLHREFKVALWLWQWREVLGQWVQLIQAYMPDGVLAEITDQEGKPLRLSREDIAGQFHVDVAIDVRDMDPEFIKIKGEILRDVLLTTDRAKVIDTSPAVKSMFCSLFPDVAEASLRTVDQASQTEIEDEIAAYQEIRAGKEPELADDGSINYALRLQLYQNMQAMNPAIYADMADDKRAILQSRLQRLEVLAGQYGENVQIGREGGKRALGPARGQMSEVSGQ